jgi:quercetin dioxygenase-like cupin family protein
MCRVLLGADGISVANLRFAERATIDAHDAPYEIDVICTAGSGYTSIGPDTFAIASGQTVRWPRGLMHRLWTESTTMETLMIERHGGR